MAREAMHQPFTGPRPHARELLPLNVWAFRKPIHSERLSPSALMPTSTPAEGYRRPQIQMKRGQSQRTLVGKGRSLMALRPMQHSSTPNLALGGRIVGIGLTGSGGPSEDPLATPSYFPRIATKCQVGNIGGIDKPVNQDNYFTSDSGGWHLVGVCDGHGVHGHLVSAYIRSVFPRHVFDCLPFPDLAQLQGQISAALRNAYSRCTINLRDSSIDYSNSGSTCVSVLWHGSTLACGNVGDSRAVLGRKSASAAWTAEALSVDHKPQLEGERRRIEKEGGEVSVSKITNVGPHRVYIKGQQFPGLAMSRSIGDEIAQSVGVSSEPEVSVRSLTKEDKFLIVASDGVWEFITNIEAVKIVAVHWEQGEIAKACTAIVKVAQSRWTSSDNMVDDITVTIAFLHA